MNDDENQAKYIKGHNCNLLSGQENIAIEHYIIEGFRGWYWRKGKQMNLILSCPYCGKRLTD